jgi:glycosyltransferase involved in cell wall biosynthesis
MRRADWLERLAWRRTPALTLFNSGYSRDNSQEIRYGDAEVVVPCTTLGAVPPATARAAVRAEMATPPDAVVFVHVGRLEPWKGQRVLLDAVAMLRRDKPWACWIAGSATDPAQRMFEAELRTRAQEAGIADRVRFMGERQDVSAVLAAADVYCQPNTGPEPYGLSVVEAMLAGLPVVASGSGGTLEIASPDCARLVPPDDVAAVCAALGRLLEHAEERRALGARAAARARTIASPAAHARRLAEALRPLVTAARGPS